MLQVGVGGLEAAEAVTVHKGGSGKAIPGLGSVEYLWRREGQMVGGEGRVR